MGNLAAFPTLFFFKADRSLKETLQQSYSARLLSTNTNVSPVRPLLSLMKTPRKGSLEGKKCLKSKQFLRIYLLRFLDIPPPAYAFNGVLNRQTQKRPINTDPDGWGEMMDIGI